MNFRKSLYTADHEWIGSDGTVGITEYAQDALGDVVFVELPEVGRELKAGEAFGVVESVKSVSDLYSPVDGTVAAVNSGLVDNPSWLTRIPMEKDGLYAWSPAQIRMI